MCQAIAEDKRRGMERIKNSLLEGMVGILLTIGKVAAKSLILVPMLYLFCWLTGRHLPSYETFLWFLLGGFWFTKRAVRPLPLGMGI